MPKCVPNDVSGARRRPHLQSFRGWTQGMRPPSPPGNGAFFRQSCLGVLTASLTSRQDAGEDGQEKDLLST